MQLGIFIEKIRASLGNFGQSPQFNDSELAAITDAAVRSIQAEFIRLDKAEYWYRNDKTPLNNYKPEKLIAVEFPNAVKIMRAEIFPGNVQEYSGEKHFVIIESPESFNAVLGTHLYSNRIICTYTGNLVQLYGGQDSPLEAGNHTLWLFYISKPKRAASLKDELDFPESAIDALFASVLRAAASKATGRMPEPIRQIPNEQSKSGEQQ